eukprot:g47952.t1
MGNGFVMEPFVITTTLHLTTDRLPVGVELTCRTSRKLFNLRHLQAKTKVTPTSVIELQYTDDACVRAVSEDLLQTIASTFKEAYESVGLTLNIRKMKVLHQLGLAVWSKPSVIKVHGEALENIGHLRGTGSGQSAKAATDEEIQHRLQWASVTFGRLRKTVFKNNNIKSDTKIMVYRAVVVPAHLYGSERWAVYSRHLKALEQYQQHCRANIPSIEALTTLDWLRWAGYVVHLTNARLSEQVLYNQLRKGRQAPGGERKCFSDALKASLAKCDIPQTPENHWPKIVQSGGGEIRKSNTGISRPSSVKNFGTSHQEYPYKIGAEV